MFSRRVATQLRSPILRQLGRRQLSGAADNAFNRERAAVKDHAAATSGTVVIPALAIASVNAWGLWNEHWEHKAHEPPKEEQPEYPYQNIRTKNYFWGDGDKTLFWNDKVNYHKKPEE
ncbi:hypothetical protein MBLNU459_g4005t2 [Dothideomycetes sp. NU459]